MLVNPYYIHRTLEQVFQETLQAYHPINLWLHFHTDINVTVFFLFIS